MVCDTVIGSESYWITDAETGKLSKGDTTNWNVHYDGQGKLTLKDAYITGASSANTQSNTVGIYAAGQNVSLAIVLQGENTITSGGVGVYVYAPSTGAASLNITEGEDGGSLTTSGSDKGILVQSNSDDAALTIEDADVKAKCTSSAGDGVRVRSGESSKATLTVDGGSLTASGRSTYGAGIRYEFGSGETGSGNGYLNLLNNAFVDTRDGGFASNSSERKINDDGKGIVFIGKEGFVLGEATLREDLTIGSGQSLTLADGASLSAGGKNLIVDGGTVDESIKNSLGNSVKYTPAITTTTLPNGTEGTGYSATLAVDGTTPITWSGTLPAGLTWNGNTITGIPTTAGTYQITVTATNAYGSDSKTFPLTVDEASEPAEVSVTGVSLSQTSANLKVDEAVTLTATVQPDNATNKNVTWTSSDANVATVDADGLVTAVGEGTATIIVKTEDGGKTATCAVTVKAASDPDPTPEPEPEPEPTPEPEPEEPEEVYIPSAPIADGFHEYSMGTMLYVDGKRVKGLYEYEGALYYFDESGFMVTGWVELSDGWYYFGEDGKMVTGWLQIGNVWYYLEPKTGRMVDNGLHTVGRTTYYFYDWGGMASDWWYEDENGDWYFFGGSGAMKAAQWIEWKGEWYYLTETGKMAADTDIGGYYVNAEGVWVE